MNEITRPRILLVSIGMYGQKYLSELTQKDVGSDLVGVVDPAPGLEEKFPVLREKHIPLYGGLEDFFRADSADLAVISSPIHLHVPMVLTCLDHSVHVLCEKPLCLTVEETEMLSQAACKAGRFLAVGWQLNYDRAVLKLKRDILSGRFGAPKRFQCVHAMRRGEAYYARNNWAGKITVNGREVLDSPFMNACAHNFQLMTFLLGNKMEHALSVRTVEGELYRGNPNVENFDIAALRFTGENGVPLFYYTAHPLEIKNLGPIGLGEFEHGTVTWGKGKPFRVTLDTGEEIIYGADGETPMMQKLYDAVTCVRESTFPLCGPEAGLPHLLAVRFAQALPIMDVDPAHVAWMEEDHDRFPCVQGLEDVFLQSAAAWALPKELGIHL